MWHTCRYCTRVFIGESNIWRICLQEAIGRFYIGDLSYHVFLFEFLQWLCGRVHVAINIGDFNIGKFSEQSSIANINSSPINRLVWYGQMATELLRSLWGSTIFLEVCKIIIV